MKTILSIAGKPGLYKLVSRGKSNLIVEALDETHKRLIFLWQMFWQKYVTRNKVKKHLSTGVRHQATNS